MESKIVMAAEHSCRKSASRKETLKAWVGEQRPEPSGDKAGTDTDAAVGKPGLSVPAPASSRGAAAAGPGGVTGAIDELTEDPRLRMIRLVLEALTGREIKLTSLEEYRAGEPVGRSVGSVPESDGPEGVGWGLEYDGIEQFSEEEFMGYSARGEVVSQAGYRLDFSFELTLKREFVETNTLRIRAGDARLADPLVINFDVPSAGLSEDKFAFDLDSDGVDEEISQLAPGSGFLFLDRDSDGVVTDGSELFGPATGQGFKELAAYDLDKNNWLDQNDPIFDKLRIWSRDRAGEDYFSSLSQKSIGAIFLGSRETLFSLKDQSNQLVGMVRRTGVFLSEDYQLGTVQEIDLKV